MVSFPFSFCRNLAILYIPPLRGGYIIFGVGIIFYYSYFPFTYLPAGTAAGSQHTKPIHQAADPAGQQPAPHKYPFICVLTAYYSLSLYFTNHNIITANIAFIFITIRCNSKCIVGVNIIYHNSISNV